MTQPLTTHATGPVRVVELPADPADLLQLRDLTEAEDAADRAEAADDESGPTQIVLPSQTSPARRGLDSSYWLG